MYVYGLSQARGLIVQFAHTLAETTPVKMYNSNVSCAILLSFVKNTCIKDIEDHCKHKHIQLGIELDALRKTLQQLTRRELASAGGSGGNSSGALTTTRSTASSTESLAHPAKLATSSRPPSGASRPTTPGTTRSNANGPPQEEQNEEVAAALAQQELLEKQLEVVNMAARYAKGMSVALL